MQHRIRYSIAAVAALAAICFLSLAEPVSAQQEYKGSSLNRAKNTMSGNLIRTVFYNYGLVGNIGEISGEWPIGTSNEYIGDVSPLVGVQFVHPSGDTIVSVCTSDGPRGNPDGPPGGGMFWGFEPLPGFNAVPPVGQLPKVAISNQRDSWPPFWPDKNQNDIRDRGWQRDNTDPGWAGSWNGYFGKNVLNADQETYFQMDDQADEEWFERERQNNPDTVSWWEPNIPAPGESVTIYYDALEGQLPDNPGQMWIQWGINERNHGQWRQPPQAIWPSGSLPFDTFAIRSPMTSAGSGRFSVTLPTSDVQSMHFVFSDGVSVDRGNGWGWDIYPGTGKRTYYYHPSKEDSARLGLGLRVSVRGLQWAHFLAQDCIFWLYEITNISSYTYDKVCFGMMVGTLSGGRQDSEDDLAYFDLANDITYSWDNPGSTASPGWTPVRPGEILVGYAGYAFLESPGNPVDGIDNDGDSEANSPVLTSALLYEMTQPIIMNTGRPIAMIDYDTYERTISTFPADSLVYSIRGLRYVLFPGDTVREDGRNGIDDNLNGLIDERFDSTHIGHKYVDYFTGRGLNDLMIDEARDDSIDNDQDWDPLADDVGADGVAATGDYGEADGFPTNGEPNFDKTDVDESDQIGLTAFEYFSPPGAVRMRDDPGLWTRMAPGRFDVTPDQPEDGDFIYGSGYFPLRPGQTERFSMALLFGEDLQDITDNKITVQQIYDENYNFARPPEKPTLWAVPGDGKVTLYWDGRASEASFEPVCRCYDFEGYKIYRATDPSFNEIFTVTDGMGRRVFHRPIAQFDLKDNYAYVDSTYYAHVDSAVCDSFRMHPDSAWQYVWCYRDTLMHDSAARGVSGFFPVIRNAVIFYLGDNTGITHTWTDTTVENGQTYYYAVCAYDRGDFQREILPSENSKTIVMDEAGDVTLDVNTVMVTPIAPAAGYEPPQISNLEHTSGTATGAVSAHVVDPRQVRDNMRYEISFSTVPASVTATRTAYTIRRDSLGTVATIMDSIPLIPDDTHLPEARSFSSYYDSLFNQPPGIYDPAHHFRVAATEQYDGQIGYLLIPRDTSVIAELTSWADTAIGLFNFTVSPINIPQLGLTGKMIPADYEIEWFDGDVDTSRYLGYPGIFEYPAVPVNFMVKNLTRNQYVDFAFAENAAAINRRVDDNDVIIIYDSLAGRLELGWAVKFTARALTGDTIAPQTGDLLTVRIYQPYSTADRFHYSTKAARINSGAVDLERIRVYPNPYVAVSPQEPTNLFNEGRGERRITFIHLPDQCTIRIYTVRGDLVQTLEHRSQIDDGHENWDLRSRDGLNVAYGVYLYHIDSPYGEKTGRFAVIK